MYCILEVIYVHMTVLKLVLSIFLNCCFPMSHQANVNTFYLSFMTWDKMTHDPVLVNHHQPSCPKSFVLGHWGLSD